MSSTEWFFKLFRPVAFTLSLWSLIENPSEKLTNKRLHDMIVVKGKLTLSSKHFVSMTIVGSFCSQIILQKSSTVFGNGPLQVNNMLTSLNSGICFTLCGNVCFLFFITLELTYGQFGDSQRVLVHNINVSQRVNAQQ